MIGSRLIPARLGLPRGGSRVRRWLRRWSLCSAHPCGAERREAGGARSRPERRGRAGLLRPPSPHRGGVACPSVPAGGGPRTSRCRALPSAAERYRARSHRRLAAGCGPVRRRHPHDPAAGARDHARRPGPARGARRRGGGRGGARRGQPRPAGPADGQRPRPRAAARSRARPGVALGMAHPGRAARPDLLAEVEEPTLQHLDSAHPEALALLAAHLPPPRWGGTASSGRWASTGAACGCGSSGPEATVTSGCPSLARCPALASWPPPWGCCSASPAPGWPAGTDARPGRQPAASPPHVDMRSCRPPSTARHVDMRRRLRAAAVSRRARPAAWPAGCAADGRRPPARPGPAPHRWRARSRGAAARG